LRLCFWEETLVFANALHYENEVNKYRKDETEKQQTFPLHLLFALYTFGLRVGGRQPSSLRAAKRSGGGAQSY
jgi:hypothetical protein